MNQGPTSLVESQPWRIITARWQRRLQKDQIKLKIACKGSQLYIIFICTADRVLRPQEAIELVRPVAQQLQRAGIAIVKIGAQSAQAAAPLWVEKVDLRRLILNQDLEEWLEPGPVVNLAPEVSVKSPAQRYLRLRLGNHLGALLPVDSIREVVQILPHKVLIMPHTPAWAMGLYDWRGELIWLVNLDHLLGFPGSRLESGMAIALQNAKLTLGLWVSHVEEIEAHYPQQMQPPRPGLVAANLAPYVQGYFSAINSLVLQPSALFQAIQLRAS
jgi:chemotaxis signal transduction protein